MLPFDDEPDEVAESIIRGPMLDHEKIEKALEPKKPRKAKETAPEPVSVPVQRDTQPMTEERSALRFNVLLRRFIVNGYRMESMLGKYRVWRGEKALTGWKNDFVDAIDAVTQELLSGSNYPPIGQTLYQQIAELKGMLAEAAETTSSRDLEDRIKNVLSETTNP